MKEKYTSTFTLNSLSFVSVIIMMTMLSVFCTAEERVSTHFTACCTRITLNVPNEEG